MARTITGETKREGPKKGKKMHNLQEPKNKIKLVLLVVGNYLTHGPSNVAYM
jgi:hypothetical protein